MIDKRQNAPTGLTWREPVCQSSSAAHATKSEVFTIPRGNPGEADTEPEDSMQAELGALRRWGR
jgi:hypothetical protein